MSRHNGGGRDTRIPASSPDFYGIQFGSAGEHEPLIALRAALPATPAALLKSDEERNVESEPARKLYDPASSQAYREMKREKKAPQKRTTQN